MSIDTLTFVKKAESSDRCFWQLIDEFRPLKTRKRGEAEGSCLSFDLLMAASYTR